MEGSVEEICIGKHESGKCAEDGSSSVENVENVDNVAVIDEVGAYVDGR
jgi:hypothetical protein